MSQNNSLSFKNIVYISLSVIVLLVGIDLLTNSLDIKKYSWDFAYYIAIAKDGFSTDKLTAPFVYRYPTPFLAGMLHSYFSITIPSAFKILVYIGSFLQLLAIYLFVSYYTKSMFGGIVSMLVTAFSAVNIKFLMFDPFRPDMFAYFIVVLAVYFALTRKTILLLIVSAIGVQFREFAIVPLFAYFISLGINQDWHILKKYAIPLIVVLLLSVLLPRLVIQVSQNVQHLTEVKGIFETPKDLLRDFNWLYTIIAYFLPTLLLINHSKLMVLRKLIPQKDILFVAIYSLLVIALSMYGGSDLSRFATYLFVPQIILIGFLVPLSSRLEVGFMVIAVFLYNKIYSLIPIWNIEEYLDWYGGFSSRVNMATYTHIFQIAILVGIAFVIRNYTRPFKS